MINEKKVLALIPARGGSKGVPRKNVRMLGGKPLIAWTIEAAIQSKYIDRVMLSSEDEEIIEVAKKWGCDVPFVRPKELAQDDTPSMEVILHAIEQVKGYDYIVLLQPTSPFRTTEDIDKCIEKCVENNQESCVSIVEVSQNPYWMYNRMDNGKIVPLLKNEKDVYRRQDLPKVFILNGAIYISKIDWLQKTKNLLDNNTIGYEMNLENSLDIDVPLDFRFAEFMMMFEEK